MWSVSKPNFLEQLLTALDLGLYIHKGLDQYIYTKGPHTHIYLVNGLGLGWIGPKYLA